MFILILFYVRFKIFNKLTIFYKKIIELEKTWPTLLIIFRQQRPEKVTEKIDWHYLAFFYLVHDATEN